MPRRLMPAAALAAAVAVTCGALTAFGMPWSTDMVKQPSLAASHRPRPPADGALPAGGEFPLERWQMEARLANARPRKAAVDWGRLLFSTYCVPCHGESGRGDGPIVKVFTAPKDLTGAGVQDRADGWIFGTIRNGGNLMPRYGHELAPEDRRAIVAYVRTLGGRAQ